MLIQTKVIGTTVIKRVKLELSIGFSDSNDVSVTLEQTFPKETSFLRINVKSSSQARAPNYPTN